MWKWIEEHSDSIKGTILSVLFVGMMMMQFTSMEDATQTCARPGTEEYLTAVGGLLLYSALITFGFRWSEHPRSKMSAFEDVVAALASSIMVVLFFAFVYARIGIVSNIDENQTITSGDIIYFSFVTFTTLGYGDFSPCPGARFFAALEAFWGVTFFPVVTAVLIRALNNNAPKP